MVPPLIAETTTGDGPAGETVWVKQGKTDHLAQLMVPSSLCQKDFNEHGKVWVKWVTAGHYEAVPADSITFLESGRRHHGRVSNHGGVVTASKFAKTGTLTETSSQCEDIKCFTDSTSAHNYNNNGNINPKNELFSGE